MRAWVSIDGRPPLLLVWAWFLPIAIFLVLYFLQLAYVVSNYGRSPSFPLKGREIGKLVAAMTMSTLWMRPQ